MTDGRSDDERSREWRERELAKDRERWGSAWPAVQARRRRRLAAALDKAVTKRRGVVVPFKPLDTEG